MKATSRASPPSSSVIATIPAAPPIGLAYVLASDHAARLGTCAAPACDRVFIDASRNVFGASGVPGSPVAAADTRAANVSAVRRVILRL